MKLASMLIGALAAVASAAPAAPAATENLEKRGKMDMSEYNDFAFKNEGLQYFNAINKLDLEAFAKASVSKNLDASDFKRVFVRDVLDIDALLQLQVVAVVAQFADAGLFDDFDKVVIKIKTLDLGRLSRIGRFDVDSLIDDSLVPHMKSVIKKANFKRIFLDDKFDAKFVNKFDNKFDDKFGDKFGDKFDDKDDKKDDRKDDKKDDRKDDRKDDKKDEER